MTKRHYRPVCPDWLWRSPKTSELNEGERGALAYLLTSPFSNYVGVFELVPRLAAAEMRISEARFRTRLRRLEELDLVETEANYLLFKDWFMNSSWQVFLKPRATARVPSLRAMQLVPTRLVASWRISAEAAGVPPTIVTKFLADAKVLSDTGEEPASGAVADGGQAPVIAHTLSIPDGYGSANNTTTTKDPNASNTTATTPSGASLEVELDRSEDRGVLGLLLNELAEPHRRTLLAATSDLPAKSRQELGDELSACLAAAALGQRDPIHSVKAWINSLADEIRAGFSVAARGLELAKARDAEQSRIATENQQAQRRRQEHDQESERARVMQEALTHCSTNQRQQVLAAAMVFASQPPSRPLGADIQAQVIAGQLPGALAGVHVRKALQELNLVATPLASPARRSEVP